MGHVFRLYLEWSLIIGGIFVVIIVLFTSTPLSRLIAKPRVGWEELDD